MKSEDKFKIIVGFKPKNERVAWSRKLDKMQTLIQNMEPIENKLLELYAEKQKHMDEITQLRNIMIKDCIHPVDFLVDKITYVECKFCNDKIRVLGNGDAKKS